jgi:flavorubredoxin
MTTITEIAPEVFRINTFFSDFNLGFSQFLVRDDEPLLFHTGMKGLFPIVREAVGKLIDESKLRWVGFSHFEADECGSLNEWQTVAPEATAVCSLVGKMVSVDDFAPKNPAKGMMDGETFSTGSKKFRFMATPHVPHCWEAGMLFEETTGTLFCTDLLHQNGDVEAKTNVSVIDRARETFIEYQQGPLANYFPFTANTEAEIARLAALQPKLLATMHGSVFEGDGEKELNAYAAMLKEQLG